MTPFSVVLHSGDFDRIHYGLVMATTAAALGKQVTVFVTMRACRAFACNEGWRELSLSSGVAGIEVATPEQLEAYFCAQKMATFQELIEAAKELSIRFMVCEMGLRAERLAVEELDASFGFVVGGMAGFLQQAAVGVMVMV